MSVAAQETRRADRRDAILDVAHECFVAEGYGRTSMSTIAARLGGSKGTLYNYFRSKEELFEAFVRRSCDQLYDVLDAAPEDGDLRGRMIALAESFLEHILSPGSIAIQRLVVGEGERFPELARMFYEAGPQRGVARGAAMLQELMDRGALRRADPEIAAHQFKSLALAGVHNLRLWGVVGDLTPEETRAKAVIAADTFLRAYAP
jgi:TetR/AcrR family transcriptional repressor of mexJK operon